MKEPDDELREATRAAKRAVKYLRRALKTRETNKTGYWGRLELKAILHRQAAVAAEVERYKCEAEGH